MFDGRGSMRIARALTSEHLRSLRAYIMERPEGKKVRRREFGMLLVPMTLMAFTFLVLRFGREPLLFLVSPIIGLVITYLLGRYLDSRADAAFVAANAQEFGHQEFWLEADGFGNSTPAGSTFHKWHTISAVESAPGLVFIAGGAHVYAIPTEATDAEGAAFLAELKDRWQDQRSR